MRASSGIFEVCLEGLPVLEHGPEDVDASAREGDEGLVVAFSFSPFAIVEDAAVGGVQRAEGGLVEDALQGLIAAGRSLEKADFTGLPQHRSEPGRRGQGIGGAEALEVACLVDQLGGEHGPHAGQAADEGGARVASEQGLQLFVELGDALAGAECLDGQLADQCCTHAFTGDADGLASSGVERTICQGFDVAQVASMLQRIRLPKRQR